MTNKPLALIGSTAFVSVGGISHIPAKVDTGADSSSIWASHINITPAGELEFTLFDENSPLYTGEFLRFAPGEYAAGNYKTSTGERHCRYRVKMPVTIGDRTIRATFSLADRAANSMPVLIGRRALAGKFYVDVRENPTGRRPRRKGYLTRELRQDPQAFHQKYKGDNL